MKTDLGDEIEFIENWVVFDDESSEAFMFKEYEEDSAKAKERSIRNNYCRQWRCSYDEPCVYTVKTMVPVRG